MIDVQKYIDNKLVHSIHTSERRVFRGCRRRWDWSYRGMYYPTVTPEPLEFGVAFHKAMEFYYQPDTWHDKFAASQLALVAFKTSCDEQYRNYVKLNGAPSYETVDRYKARIDLGMGMLKYYFNEIAPDYDKDWTPVEVEVAFEVPILDPESGHPLLCKCQACFKKWSNQIGDIHGNWDGLPVTYGGRLDALFKDEYNNYWICDWKTTSRMLDEGKEASFLQLEDQISSYVWALSVIGIPVSGFVYVEFKKSFPKPPEQLSRPYKGKMYSTNKQYMTNVKMFKDTVSLYDNDAYQIGHYDDHLNWLETEGPVFTQRHQIHRNAAEIKSSGINIAYEAMDMVNFPRIYPQAGRFSCPTCLFQQPCISKNDGSDHMYLLENLFEKRQQHYYEEKPVSTD